MFAARLVCALGLATGAFGQTYVEIRGHNGLNPADATFPNSINEQGAIAGYYMTGDLIRRGFVRAVEGTITSFDVPGSFVNETVALSINAAGSITGYYIGLPFIFPTGFTNHGYVRDPFGNFTTFDAPGSISTTPQSINTRGFIAGFYAESNLLSHGFVREPSGHIISFDPPGSISTKPVSINFDGAIAGFYNEANLVIHGFVRKPDGEIISFDPPGSTGTIVASINYPGAITGYYTVANGRAFGFVRHPDGKFTSFDPGVNTQPTSINNKGAITGSYANDTGTHGFVRSPEGVITSFDPPFPPTSCPTAVPFLGGQTFPTSINDNGVITGYCNIFSTSLDRVGFARYPAMSGF
jgi:hypothetical protein